MLLVQFVQSSIRWDDETEAEADSRTSRRRKPKPKPKPEKIDISVRFGLIWFGFRVKSAQAKIQ
jgi:hypothetical protein